jgi:DNA-binding transcriptional MerR regulator
MTEEKLSLKEMCARFDVTPRTLRHYEYIELLQPEKVGRTRNYGSREVARLKLILRGRRFGFPLEEVRQWLLLYDVDPQNRKQTEIWIEMSGRQIDELENRKIELEETIEELKRLRQVSFEALQK